MSTVPPFVNDYALPGMGAVVETFENDFFHHTYPGHYYVPGVVSSASTDSGNTGNTSLLRKGLLMSYDRLNKVWKPWTPYTPNGTTNNYLQSIDGILGVSLDLTGGSNRQAPIVIRCSAKVSNLIIAGSAFLGLPDSPYRYLAARQLAPGILIDDLSYSLHNNLVYVSDDTEGAPALTNYPNGTTFVFSGANAVSWTLPAPLPGLQYKFVSYGTADIVLAAATADTLIAPEDAAADSVTLSDIGDIVELLGITTAATPTHQWMVVNHAPVAASSSLGITT